MQPHRPVGIVGYGSYVPRYRLAAAEVARTFHPGKPVGEAEKAVPGPGEDTFTIALAAARHALARAASTPEHIGAVWVGSESHPYAVKPTSTLLAAALGVGPHTLAADFQFACKAGTEALQAAMGLVGSEMVNYALGVGADVAQARPGDALAYTAAAGGAAFLLGPAAESLATIEASCSYVTDTPDFWRRPGAAYPSHGQRFTGEPAYFHHTRTAAQQLMTALGYTAKDFQQVVFHQPNAKFPTRVAQELGFEKDQWEAGLLFPRIGNTYAGATLLGLTAVLDVAQPGDKILCVSFGSGAGSDAFVLTATPALCQRKNLAPTTESLIAQGELIDYATYARYTHRV